MVRLLYQCPRRTVYKRVNSFFFSTKGICDVLDMQQQPCQTGRPFDCRFLNYVDDLCESGQTFVFRVEIRNQVRDCVEATHLHFLYRV